MRKEILNDFMHGVPGMSWLDSFCLPDGALRYPTIKAALTAMTDFCAFRMDLCTESTDLPGPIIVETGCQRMRDDWGAGMSTTIFAKFLDKYFKHSGKLLSCDINPKAVQLANAVTEEYAHLRKVVQCDSVQFLTDFKEILAQLYPNSLTTTIDLLYLDSWDFPDGELRAVVGDDWPNTPFEQARDILGDKLKACQEHCLKELQAAETHFDLHRTVVLIDDNSLPGGGKSWLAKQYMLDSKNYEPILDSYQSLWLYKG